MENKRVILIQWQSSWSREARFYTMIVCCWYGAEVDCFKAVPAYTSNVGGTFSNDLKHLSMLGLNLFSLLVSKTQK